MRILAAVACGMLLLILHADAESPEEVVARQREEAEKLWKYVLTKGAKTPTHTTENFFFIGTVDARQLEPLGRAAEKALPEMLKTLRMEGATRPWEGNIIVHVCKGQAEFRALHFRLTRTKARGDEGGCHAHEGKTTHLALAPVVSRTRQLPSDLELVRQLGGSLLQRKVPLGNVPVWLEVGFGRAAAYRQNPKAFMAERQQAAVLITQGKNIHDVQNSNLQPWEQTVLSASLADFLANGSAMEKYWPAILDNLGGDRDFYATAREVELDLDLLQKSWAAWARNPR